MSHMFSGAQSFNRVLCGVAWTTSTAIQDEMFKGSRGAITICKSPQSRAELKLAVNYCLRLSAVGDCSAGPLGPIRSWDVSAVNDMHLMFGGRNRFNQELSFWDVSAVTDMGAMFYDAQSFNEDLSLWDVSTVTNMGAMFAYAQSFNQDLSSWDVSAVTDM